MHLQAEQESIFRTVFAGWLRLEVYLDRLWGDDQKQVNFFGKKVHPPNKILATPMPQPTAQSNTLKLAAVWAAMRLSSLHVDKTTTS